MPQNPYEDLYRSAIYSLGTIRGGRVVREITRDGIRHISVDGVPMTDDQLFELAWGREMADHIRRAWKP